MNTKEKLLQSRLKKKTQKKQKLTYQLIPKTTRYDHAQKSRARKRTVSGATFGALARVARTWETKRAWEVF